MINHKFNKDYWEQKYAKNATGWDIGYSSPALTTYFDQLTNKNLRILIPGGGNSYEAEYLFEKGFKNVFVIDIAEQPLLNFKNRVPAFPEENLIQTDFFNHKESYDLIMEQTFFCALDPIIRKDYMLKMSELLTEKGKLFGLLFDVEFSRNDPPFGGSKQEYTVLAENNFNIITLESCYNSIKPRQGTELFFIFEKK